MAQLAFNLRAECYGHEEDVRRLAVGVAGFATASRDKTVKLWVERDAHAFDNTASLIGHEDYVSAVTIIEPGTTDAYPKGAIVSGSRDKSVIVWDLQSGQPIRKLAGHKWQVTDVAVMQDGNIASSSLDGTVRIWDSAGGSVVLKGHEGPVQCLLVLPDGRLLSGSNDKTIRVWSGTNCVQTLNGHTDTVRGLGLVPSLGFVSASHDQTLQLWTAGGEPIATLAGHTALVYSAAATADGLIASASEDNTARLWQPDGTCLQTVEHPACVWDVAFLPNGDLVTACADFAARVWTASAERAAPAEAVKSFQERVEARKAASSGQGTLPEGLTLEDAAALIEPGQRDGQTKVIREGGSGMAYSWSAARQEWEKVGEVVNGPGDGQADTMAVGGKQLYGQTWDYVFDVDIADGAPAKKLAVNRGENPYDAADRFMELEGLPISYREQIVNFIVQNSYGGVVMPGVPAINVDPFTGSGAYVPAGPPAAGGSSSGLPSSTMTGGGADPFTGNSSAPAQPTAPLHVPATTFVTFASAPNAEAIARKIRATSDELGAAGGPALAADEAAPGGLLDQLLSRASSAGKAQSNAAPTDQLALLGKLLSWPAAQLFPALDIARLLVLDAAFASALAENAGNLADGSPGTVGRAFAAAIAEPQTTANQQTALRLAANVFQHASLRQWVASQASSLMDGFAACLETQNKSVRLGMATFLLNCAVLQEPEIQMQALSGLAILLNSTEADAESQYRAVVALGTVVHKNSQARSLAADLEVAADLKRMQAGAPGKLAEASRQVLKLLSV